MCRREKGCRPILPSRAIPPTRAFTLLWDSHPVYLEANSPKLMEIANSLRLVPFSGNTIYYQENRFGIKCTCYSNFRAVISVGKLLTTMDGTFLFLYSKVNSSYLIILIIN